MREIEKYELLMHGVQAMRRRVEGIACPIAGASGVRAQFIPHQTQNVQRILTSTRIRHLIADEVGMGKTVQALMVAHALRLQTGKLRVCIVVPHAETQRQWIEEITCRHQRTPVVDDQPGGEDWIYVVVDSGIAAPSATLDPLRYDLLILDEPQSLRADTLRFVASNSGEITRLLLLTASPNLRDLRHYLETLQMLEPERMQRARRETEESRVDEDLDWSRSRMADLPLAALRAIDARFESLAAGVLDRHLDTGAIPAGVSEEYAAFAEHRKIRVVLETRWCFRRILRAYREQFPEHLPRRETRDLRVEPTTYEVERMRLIESYVSEFVRNYPERRYRRTAENLLSRACLGGRSFQARIRELRRKEEEDEPRLERIAKLIGANSADSRLDCLVDWLIAFWSTDPLRKVLIVAEDNATIEELAEELRWRIPQIGPRSQRVPLRIVTARDDRPHVGNHDDVAASETLRNVEFSQLRPFEQRDAQLLLAHHLFRHSFNLQAASALVFYAFPWKPEDVDQWIGRVDRLGRQTRDLENAASGIKPIRIVSIHRTGDPSVAVHEIMDEFRIFEAPLDPELQLIDLLSTRIEASVFSTIPERLDSAKDSSRADKETVIEADGDLIESPSFDRHIEQPYGSPWDLETAKDLYRDLSHAETFGPALRHTTALGYCGSNGESALSKWIKLLRSQDYLRIRKFPGERQSDGLKSRTFFTMVQHAGVSVALACLQDRNHPFVPFFIARKHIQRPPRMSVDVALQGETSKQELLSFLSFGSTLHDELIEKFEQAGHNVESRLWTLHVLGKRHYPHGTDLQAGRYLCGAGYVDPSEPYRDRDPERMLLQNVLEAKGTRIASMRDREVAALSAGFEADARFVRIQRRATACLFSWKMEDGRWIPCSEMTAIDLIGGNWSNKDRPYCESQSLSEEHKRKISEFAKKRIADECEANWKTDFQRTIERFEERKEVIRVEAEDACWVIRSMLLEARRAATELEHERTERNERALRLNYQPRIRQLEEELRLTERACELRLGLLDECLIHLSSPSPDRVRLQCAFAVDIRNDPVPLPARDSTAEPAEAEYDDLTIADSDSP